MADSLNICVLMVRTSTPIRSSFNNETHHQTLMILVGTYFSHKLFNVDSPVDDDSEDEGHDELERHIPHGARKEVGRQAVHAYSALLVQHLPLLQKAEMGQIGRQRGPRP
jgi:hypothetical protein